MAIVILPQAATVHNAAPWLLTPGLTFVCRCGVEFTPHGTDTLEADGKYNCPACETEALRWHRELNFDINYGVSDRG